MASVVQPAHADDPRRELWLRCTETGHIVEVDAVAVARLSAAPGRSLHSLAVEGSEEKVRVFLARAARGKVDGFELALVVRGAPSTVCCAARPVDRSGEPRLIDVYAVLYPEGYSNTVQQLAEALDEMQSMTRDISRQRKELEAKNHELTTAYRELDESNRGVITLHAELSDRNDSLRRAADVKARLVANVSHEFRTPLHTILGLSRLLLEGADGSLSDEQQKQIRFIRTAAEELSQMVNDLLDLSKTESGRAILRPHKFSLRDFLAGLRGALRPLQRHPGVVLAFDEPEDDVVLDTDQGKLSQVVRNLVSNALKFTEHGEVRVMVELQGPDVSFAVRDTGVGIAAEHFGYIFEEFGQVENALQGKVKGTGLGLPLSRKLAELLGGSLAVASELGSGSTFTLTVPRLHPEVRELAVLETRPLDPARAPVLVVEDDRKTIFIYEKFLSLAGFQVVPARDTSGARRILESVRPAAIVLDIMLDGESSWEFLGELKRNPETSDIPVLVVTVTNKEQKARALGADEFWLKPVDQGRLLRKLRSLTQPGIAQRVLVIDDDERARYLIRKFLDNSPFQLLEAATGPEGVRVAREAQPSVILLDFLLRDVTAFDVLDELKGDPRTRHIPVVVVTSHALDSEERQRLASHAEAILSKENLSRELAINRIRDALRKAGLGPLDSPGDGVADAGR